MKTNYKNLALSMLSLSVQGALVAMFAIPTISSAETDDEAVTLTNPTNYVELGAENIPKGSAKFGEYNGLNKPGVVLIGNFNIRGGDSYGEGSGIRRWSITGSDVGTTSREFGASASDQGSWDVGIKFDELRHNITDTYQTPLQGSMGGNVFTLNSGFGIVNTGNPNTTQGTAPSPSTNAPFGSQALTDIQKSYFHTVNVHSDRENTTFSAGYNIEPEWNVKFEFNHLEQSGAKLISSSSYPYGLNSAASNTAGGMASTKEAMQVLMNPTNYKTDSGNLALNWAGDKGHMTGSYNFSLFQNANNSLNFADPFYAPVKGTSTFPGTYAVNGTTGYSFPIDALSTAPDNQFHQINLNGGYKITPSINVVGGLSYGRNTQNDSYVNQDQMQLGGLPQTSLHGLVVTTHADFKLTDQLTKNLTVNAGVKYNERDNQTASNTYKFYDLGGATETAINTPLSNSKTQLELTGDYRIDQKQKLHFGYEFEQIKRWCDSSPSASQINAASGGYGAGATGTAAQKLAAGILAAQSYYALGSSCVQVPESNESKLLANYRLVASEDVILTTGYSFSRRIADLNQSFYNPMQANKQGFELPGYAAFFDASRTENLLKAGLNWQTTEKLSLGVNGRYVHDNYDSTLGVQSGHVYSVNFDSTYNIADKTALSAYLTIQNRSRDFRNDAGNAGTSPSPSLSPWTNSLSSDDTTFGLNANHGGLLGGKLDIVSDLTYSLSTSSYATAINYGQSTNTCTASSTSGYICGALPDIRSEMIKFKLAGNYKVDKANRVVVGYLYQHLNSNDYYYNAYQTGYTPTSLMPTNQQAPSYSQSVLYASYVYEFR